MPMDGTSGLWWTHFFTEWGTPTVIWDREENLEGAGDAQGR